MGASYLSLSAVCTLLSFVGLQCWTTVSLERLRSNGLIGDAILNTGDARHALDLLLGSYTTIALVANFVLNVFVLLILSLKTVFFTELQSSEIRKLVERLINYIIYKGTFLPLVVPPTVFETGLWSVWLGVLCSLKMFQALARERLERLNASPSVTPWTYFRVYSALLLVFFVNILWLSLCLTIYKRMNSSTLLLLFFEPLSIAFETLQAIVVHGFQFLDVWLHDSAGDTGKCRISKLFDFSATGSFSECKGAIVRNLGFFLDIMTFLMALAHYLYIWWLHGMAFHLADAVLFLNIRALLSAMLNRIKSYIKLRMALGALHGALPDATMEELQAYDDECAICREPMAKAKKLPCNHLYHLACLRSWLDQGLNENHSCPTCRKPHFMGRLEHEVNPHGPDLSVDEQLARQLSAGLDHPNRPGHSLSAGVFPNQTQNSFDTDDWRGTGIDPSWLGLDGAGPSSGIRSVGLGRVQMMMRHLAAVGETYAQTALDDGNWSLWPMNSSQAGTSRSAVTPGSVRYAGNSGGLHVRSSSRVANDNLVNILSMVETVREVLPHIPDEIIIQDLQRTDSVTVTVNNLLQM